MLQSSSMEAGQRNQFCLFKHVWVAFSEANILFEKGFNFESFGIGGLDKEFSDIFRYGYVVNADFCDMFLVVHLHPVFSLLILSLNSALITFVVCCSMDHLDVERLWLQDNWGKHFMLTNPRLMNPYEFAFDLTGQCRLWTDLRFLISMLENLKRTSENSSKMQLMNKYAWCFSKTRFPNSCQL